MFLLNYFSRHKNNINRLLHLIGIPLVIFGLYSLLCGRWALGLASFIAGYICQWAGHVYFEKNEVGEWALIKKIIRR